MAAWNQREHQRSAPPILPQRHRSQQTLPKRPGRCRRSTKQPTPQNPRLEDPRRDPRRTPTLPKTRHCCDDPLNPSSVYKSERERRDRLGGGWDAEIRSPNRGELPLLVEVTGPSGRESLAQATTAVRRKHEKASKLLADGQATRFLGFRPCPARLLVALFVGSPWQLGPSLLSAVGMGEVLGRSWRIGQVG